MASDLESAKPLIIEVASAAYEARKGNIEIYFLSGSLGFCAIRLRFIALERSLSSWFCVSPPSAILGWRLLH